MARQKKDYIVFNARLDSYIMKRFNEYCEEVGQTKTKALERILSNYLEDYYKENKDESVNKEN